MVDLDDRDEPLTRAQESRFLYERLGDQRFQELCQALLAREFPGVRCYPVGQSDGGRDAVAGSTIFQVKWTSKPQQDPFRWLADAIRGEAGNIRRLAAEGASVYYLLTSIAGTSAPRRGTMDRLDDKLHRFEDEFGIEMRVWWRSDIDTRVRNAPNHLVWEFHQMLAGTAAVRYLIEADRNDARDRELRGVLQAVMATQWQEDARVKFQQVELTEHDLTDLFVDVEAVRVALPQRLRNRNIVQDRVGGAAAYLVETAVPLTLVRGEPGQGKSTLGQYLCQVHRAEFLPDTEFRTGRRPSLKTSRPRVPLRIDLRDYATWMAGEDPFTNQPQSGGQRVAPSVISVEAFLLDFLRVHSGRSDLADSLVSDLLNRFPVLLVLDGLDEVAQAVARHDVVHQIDQFVARCGGLLDSSGVAIQIVVSTRPNASGLAEPSTEVFETISLVRMTDALRSAYLQRWAAAYGIIGRERVSLEHSFRQRMAEPHIVQLAANPMQLTILLYLMRRRGISVPSGRSELYSSYMETFLDREAAKSPAVEAHREVLEEVTAFLAWHLQSEAESSGTDGRMPERAIRKCLLNYLFDVHRPTELVDDLFTAVTDRVWALTSKVQGTFEFDILPMREYFAARYLHEFAGADDGSFDSSRVLRALVCRPYWLNVVRFYAGFARPNELGGIVDALAEELEQGQRTRQVLLGAWEMLADGVFAARSRAQVRAANLFRGDLVSTLLPLVQHDGSEIAADRGATDLAEMLRDSLQSDPTGRLADIYIDVLTRTAGLESTRAWWRERLIAETDPVRQLAWLRLGRRDFGRRLPQADLDRLSEVIAQDPVAAIRAAVEPVPGSADEEAMLRAVLAGEASSLAGSARSLPGAVLSVGGPADFIGRARAIVQDSARFNQQGPGPQARTYLGGLDRKFAELLGATKPAAGQSGTTSLWNNSARALASLFGPNWLATEIAVMAAALPSSVVSGGDVTPDSEPLGPDPDYGRLVLDIRSNQRRARWWTELFVTACDPLSRAGWALALVAAASRDVVTDQLDHLQTVSETLPAPMLTVLVTASDRLSRAGFCRPLPYETFVAAAQRSSTVGLLTAHYLGDRSAPLYPLTDRDLADLHIHGAGAGRALEALTARILGPRRPVSELCALEALRDVPCGDVDLPTTDAALAAIVVSAPNAFPTNWVIAAEHARSRSIPLEPLIQIAHREHWFRT